MKLNIKQVGAIQQDFTGLKIKIFSKQNLLLWEKSYSNTAIFENAFTKIMSEFDKELKRRSEENES